MLSSSKENILTEWLARRFERPYGGITMISKSVSRILFLTVVTAMALSVAGCAKPVEEADVVGTYVKDDEQPVKFRTSSTEVTLAGTDGEVTLQLRAGGEAELGDQTLPWTLEDGKVTIYFLNASSSGDFKGSKIVGLGGEGMTWTKK